LDEQIFSRDWEMNMRPQNICAAVAALLVCSVPAFSQELFRGKTIRIIAGSVAGGYYDNYARLMARHLGEYLPGNPTVIVGNMPGASGVQAANYIQEVAPKDGTALATFNKSMPFYEVIGAPGVRFNSKELTWIGALSQSVDTIAMWHTTGVKTIEDAKKREFVMGAVSAVGTTYIYPALLNATIGTKFRMVTGYSGGILIDHGMEKGEVEGRGSNQWASWKSEHPDWVKEGKIVPIVQIGLRKEPDLRDVPMLTELAQNDEQRRIFEFISNTSALDGPLVAPPGMPVEITNALRKGFDAMVANPVFIRDAVQAGVDLSPLTGARTAELAARVTSAPRDLVEKVKAMIAAKPEASKAQ
jgi:tripartite-type tricarboxylate transporter receptor subunit TctC